MRRRSFDELAICVSIIIMVIVATVAGLVTAYHMAWEPVEIVTVRPTPDVDGLGAETTLHGVMSIVPGR